jgi:hypothetical protein
MRTEKEWEAAKAHFDEVVSDYVELIDTPGVNVNFALAHVFKPLIARYNEGERTDNLYESMLEVK